MRISIYFNTKFGVDFFSNFCLYFYAYTFENVPVISLEYGYLKTNVITRTGKGLYIVL